MIPRTYPSTVNSTSGQTEAAVAVITDTTGLVRWVDYTPVQFVNNQTSTTNSYNNNGYILVNALQDLTNKQAGKDYIRIFEDNTATKKWSTDNAGFIPVYAILNTVFVECDYVDIQDCNFNGNINQQTAIATNSVDSGNNSDWTFV
jgi:hypothetical protein